MTKMELEKLYLEFLKREKRSGRLYAKESSETKQMFYLGRADAFSEAAVLVGNIRVKKYKRRY